MSFGRALQQFGGMIVDAGQQKRDREERARQQALQQAQFDFNRQQALDQDRRVEANKLYDQTWQLIQNAPEGLRLSQEQVNQYDPRLMSIYAQEKPAELQSRDLGTPLTNQAQPKQAGFELQQPESERARIEGMKAQQRAVEFQTRESSRREALAQKRDIELRKLDQIAREAALNRELRQRLTGQQIAAMIQAARMRIASGSDENMVDAQSAWDVEYMRQLGRDPNYTPPVPRPTKPPQGGKETKPARAPLGSLAGVALAPS